MTPVEHSYKHCRRVARSQAKNFYYSFLLLSKPQRDAMCAVYTFMRYCDDLSDGPNTASAATMRQWRSELDAALNGQYGSNPCWPAFHDAVRRYNIPHHYFHEMIDGVSSDLQPRDIQTFEELYKYCYQVASVVGLTIIHIFEYESQHALLLAEKCGVAFQLTNIIRDVKEDQEKGRIYIPKEDRDRYPELTKLLSIQAGRARRYYDESRPLLDLVHPRSRRSLWALIEIYSTLLDRIVQSGYDVVSRRIRLSGVEKVGIILRALFR
ncbi:MAG TPA: phytoene/squalene synthase family protein [Bryobacteraceae bacterium]|nr:phytoene/squalene synthase family protein [Bryobacteraceae bacterium]